MQNKCPNRVANYSQVVYSINEDGSGYLGPRNRNLQPAEPTPDRKGHVWGLTHYWKRKTELPLNRFTRAANDCRKVLPGLGVPLTQSQSHGAPQFRTATITFNGSPGHGCETFEIRATAEARHGDALSAPAT